MPNYHCHAVNSIFQLEVIAAALRQEVKSFLKQPVTFTHINHFGHLTQRRHHLEGVQLILDARPCRVGGGGDCCGLGEVEGVVLAPFNGLRVTRLKEEG